MPGKKIRVGLVGVGNCAAGLVQAVELVKEDPKQTFDTVTNQKIAGYGIEDIQFTSAFDVGENKIGKPLSQAIYETPNAVNWKGKVTDCEVEVMPSPVMDGV